MRTINDIVSTQNEAQARIGELYTAITDEVAADADLTDLTSPSKTADFSLWKFIWAAVAWIQEGLFGEFKKEVDAKVLSAIPGTDYWFQKELLKFQYGDALLFDVNTGKSYYATINESLKIIKRCAVVSNGGLTQIKVAKEVAGLPVALSGGELAAFTTYVRRKQWAGSNVAAPTSFSSDKLNAPLTVYYDGIIPLDDFKPTIQAAFNSYLQNLPFNGEFKISALQDAIQAVTGVNDVVMGVVQAKADAGAYVNVVRVYYPVSGYIERDATIAFDTMITYTAQ